MLKQVFHNLGVQHLPPPALDLNFLTGVLDPRITFSGGAGGTCVNPNGVLVPSSGARFDYDPITKACKGLLVEEQRTNLLLWSDDISNAAWAKTRASVGSPITGPNGAAFYKLIEDTTAASTHNVSQNISATLNAQNSFAFHVKAAERTSVLVKAFNAGASTNFIQCQFDVSAGTTTGAASGGNGGSASGAIAPAGNGVYKVALSGIVDSATASGTVTVQVFLINGSASYTGDGVSGAYVGVSDAQAGSFMTSHIPTTSAAVTRTADSAYMTGTNFASALGGITRGTLFVEWEQPTVVVTGQFPTLAGLRIATDNTQDTVEWFLNGSVGGVPAYLVRVGNVNQFSANLSAAAPGSINRGALAFAANSFAASLNGGSNGSQLSGSVPSPIVQLDIGLTNTAIGTRLNSRIRKVRVYPPSLGLPFLQRLAQ